MKTGKIFTILILLAFIGATITVCSQGSISNAPGREHEYLTLFEGKWRQLFSSFPTVTQEAVYGNGQTENELIYGGRYIVMNGELNLNGFMVHSRITIGFDNRIGKYFLFGIDELGTNAINAKGDFDKKKMEFNFYGEDIVPNSKDVLKFRINIKFEGRDKYIYSLFINENGKEKQKLEIVNVKL